MTDSLAGLVVLVSALAGQAGDAYVERIDTRDEFDRLSRTSDLPPALRSTKFMVPVRDDDPSLLPTLFQNVNIHALHIEFLKREFPERFPALSQAEYDALVNIRGTRDYFVGVLFQFTSDQYGFNVWAGSADSDVGRIEQQQRRARNDRRRELPRTRSPSIHRRPREFS